MKKKRRLKRWVKVTLCVMLIGGFGLFLHKITHKIQPDVNIETDKTIVLKEENIKKEPQKEAENDVILVENTEKSAENTAETIDFEPKIEQNKQAFRLTSYYPTEDTDCTGSGKCSWDFQVNDKGWYTWNGKIVLAAATTYLQKSFGYVEGKKYFKYYDEVNVTIDGIDYKGVILDSCGACMKVTYEERLDLFVNSGENAIDRGYKGNNPIYVNW